MNGKNKVERSWFSKQRNKEERTKSVQNIVYGKVIPTSDIVEVFEKVIKSGDRVALEGNNQKQADFLSRNLSKVSNKIINNLHIIIPSISRPEHLDIFEDGIARKVDFSFAGPQSLRISQLIEDNILEIGAIHTYIELYARLFIDLTPDLALVAAYKADKNGNLYTGPSTEDTPAIVEATAFKNGIVIAQVNEIVDDPSDLPRVDIPGSWIDFIVQADKPFYIEPLFTRDPRQIKPIQILMGMMAIKGIYAKHEIKTLNHGIGFNTAAIELLLPTYGNMLGLRGKICKHWALNPHPTLIPAIESGWVESVHSFGGELGMEKYLAARPDIFFTGPDGSMRSNRAFCQMAGQYAVDMFIGSTLQCDKVGNSSTVTRGRLSGFGGAPNMGSNPNGRRHSTKAWLDMMKNPNDIMSCGKKLVVQIVETFQAQNKPTFVERLDAESVAIESKMPIAPVMIYGDDVTHIVTEEGIAYLYRASNIEERKDLIAAIAGITPIGLSSESSKVKLFRKKGLIAYPQDLDINRNMATRSLLAAKSMSDLVDWSDGLYEPPARFRSW